MNKIKLVNKIIDVDNSRIIYDKPIADDWQNDWQVMQASGAFKTAVLSVWSEETKAAYCFLNNVLTASM